MSGFVLSMLVTTAWPLGGLADLVVVAEVGATYMAVKFASADPEGAATLARWAGYALRK